MTFGPLPRVSVFRMASRYPSQPWLYFPRHFPRNLRLRRLLPSRWWRVKAQALSAIPHILILADTGGSNGAQRGAWKQEIQRQLCDGLGLRVTVSHYPSGASKWNPIEHRLFSQISKNWEAEPLDSYEKALKFIRTTTTTTGLKMTAHLDTTYYPTGIKVSKRDLAHSHPAEAGPAKMELHDLTANVN